MNNPDFPGLSSLEAASRLEADGPNVLPEPGRKGHMALIGHVLREPMLLLLVAASIVYVLLGELGESLLLGASVLLVIGMTVFQEYKAEHALQALRELGSPKARVLRDGVPVLVDARDVVVGDLLLIGDGDRLAADGRVVAESDLHLDESMLTGESVPVHRCVGDSVHAGTLAVRGNGKAVVVATGTRSEMGRIGTALGGITIHPTPMQRQMRRVVRLFATLALIACVTMVLVLGIMRGSWLQAMLAGLTLAIANIPEEFPVVLTVFLALGSWRMARHSALVRRAPAIEAMGAITVLCTDKTGTLTENHMRLAELASIDGNPANVAITPDQRELLRMAVLAAPELSNDPMDRALHDAAREAGITQHGMRAIHEYPFAPALPAAATAWQHTDATLELACKGAPEAIATLCALDEGTRAAHLENVHAMAARGLRVLAVAIANPGALPARLADARFEWRGLVAFADPLRPGVRDAVAEARTAGIRVVMLTGDHAATARAIAGEAGIATDADVMSGAELGSLAQGELLDAVESTRVFARVKPEHKLRLVEALKADGEVVAMTGDGVNDAPALVAAHVGIAMGGRGTDVAREAASIVLLDDNFVTVVRAIRLGRTIYDNILRAVRYILAVHVPITGLALLPLLVGGPLVLLPLHVVFLELIIDPGCSIVLEREPPASDLMRRPPRPATQPLLTVPTMVASLMQGAIVFGVVASVLLVARSNGLPERQCGALAFSALVTGNLGLLLLFREGDSVMDVLRRRNPAFWWVASVAASLLALCTLLPLPAGWLGFSPPSLTAWAVAVVLPLASIIAMREITSRLIRIMAPRRDSRSNSTSSHHGGRT